MEHKISLCKFNLTKLFYFCVVFFHIVGCQFKHMKQFICQVTKILSRLDTVKKNTGIFLVISMIYKFINKTLTYSRKPGKQPGMVKTKNYNKKKMNEKSKKDTKNQN